MRRPTGGQTMSKKELDDLANKLIGTKNSVVNYGKSVVGGAKIVGGAIKKGVKKAVQWPGNQIEKELRMEEEKQKKYKKQGKKLNDEYSGIFD